MLPLLHLYNSATRQKEIFTPLDSQRIRLYVCGPTVYEDAHIGNFRPVVVFDLLFRVLRFTFGEEKVIYARNITDVDDKINARAAQEGRSIQALTQETSQRFQEDAAALKCLPPTHQPRATEHIAEMITIIERLLAQGYAYEAANHVLFDVERAPTYGALSGRRLEEMRAGARVEVAPP